MRSVWWMIIGVFLFAIAACSDKESSNGDDGNDTDSETETSNEQDGGVPDECIDGFDPASPVLRISGFVPTAPKPLADIAAGAQSAVDDGTINYLFTMSDISGDGEVSGALGLAEAADADDTYRFVDDSESMTFELKDNAFESTNDASLDLLIPLPLGEPLRVTMREVTLEGEFADDGRCAVGALEDEGPPSEWDSAGTLSAKILVSEAKDTTVSVSQPLPMTFTLCAYFAYGLADALALTQDPNCEEDPSEWPNPPDTTTADDDDAWLVMADIAATGALLE